MGPVSGRLARLLAAFSPWEGIDLTYRQFAAEIGPPVTAAAIKKWPQRKKFPADVARLIVSKAQQRNLSGVTLEWVLWGEGLGPQPGPREISEPATVPAHSVGSGGREAHGQYVGRIVAALQADLSRNELGQWSTPEVQRTVIWALKDLARRLRVLRFDMGGTFELTDRWAGEVGLPVRPPQSHGEPG
jgi:hypothetical protein